MMLLVMCRVWCIMLRAQRAFCDVPCVCMYYVAGSLRVVCCAVCVRYYVACPERVVCVLYYDASSEWIVCALY